MHLDNYHPWAVDPEHFQHQKTEYDRLMFLLRFAILAPSGHNSQPWGFSMRGNSIDIFVNKERSLAESDPGRRQLLVSIGCALENLLVAADYYGFSHEVHYLPEAKDQNLIARIAFSAHSKNGWGKELINSILERRTNRNKYKNQLLSEEFLNRIQKFSSKDIVVTAVVDKVTKAFVADVVNAAQIEVMEEKSFREELSHYIKSSLTKSKTGMPGFTLGMPLPISLIASHLIKRVNMSKKTMKQDDELLKLYTPTFVIVSTIHDDPMSRVKAGQVFERIWLTATKEKLSCAPLAAGVQVGEYYKELKRVLNLNSRPQAFMRIGYCDKIPHHSPRLSMEDVLRH